MHLDPRLLDIVDRVVTSIATRTSVDTDCLLLVGAEARNLLHAALGHDFDLRRTTDVDLGLAAADWNSYNDVTTTYPRSGTTGIRYFVDGILVDFMPFGAVEDPSGVSTPPSRGEPLVVYGFQDAFDTGLPLLLPSGSVVRMPSVPGYASLKMRAFLDRSAYGQEKDAQDLALAAYWYQNDPGVTERLWSDHVDLLEELEWDVDLAASFILGQDVALALTAVNRVDLDSRWAAVDESLLLRGFTFGNDDPLRRDSVRRRRVLDQLARGFRQVQ